MVMPARKNLTLTQTIIWQKKILRHDRWVLHTRNTHHRSVVKFARIQLKWVGVELQESLSSYHSVLLRTGDFTTFSLDELPHHLLWGCIHGGPPFRSSYEARDWSNKDTGHNGHYGGLQMHPDWGYGTSHLASSDSKLVQERAAETWYYSHHSTAYLLGQWNHPECLEYA